MALNFANNNSLSAITSLPASISGGAMNLISTQTASSSSTISFTSGIDSTYDKYVFKFYNIHLSDNTPFGFQANAVGESGYNETITSTSFFARHNESGSTSGLSYSAANDQAQGTSFQRLVTDQDTGNDENMGGILQLFAPSSTTFVKHFISNCQAAQASDYSMQRFVAGYFNTTSAIDEIQFKPESGTFDGVIKLYGIS